MPNPKCGPFDLKSLWQDSLRRGLFARAMGKLLGLREAEEAFAAALLQDMAIPLLAKELPEEYTELLLAARKRKATPIRFRARTVRLGPCRGCRIDGQQMESFHASSFR